MAFRVLCTGDIHIGRRASRVAETYRCAEAWSTIVDLAIVERVDLLAISGDIVDKESKSYEAIGPLEAGLKRLEQAGIATVAVSGNHDFDVLFKLSGIAGTERFHVLGRGGAWERHTCTGADGSHLHVDGWSFPREHVADNPMDAYVAHANDGIPVLGLLHGDVGVANSRYAPIHLDELWAQPIDLWLLGHIHAPRQYRSATGAIAFYPGSPWAMDPGETGVHGVWLAEFAPGQAVRLEQRAVSPVHYDRAEVDLSGIGDETDFLDALTFALRLRGTEAIAAHGTGTLQVVSCRLQLTGRTSLHRQVPLWMQRAEQELGQFPLSGSTVVQIDQLTSMVRPAIDLVQFARGNDPAGETARLILALEAPESDPRHESLVQETLDRVAATRNHNGYAVLAALDQQERLDGPTEAEIRDLLREQAWNLLSALVMQKEPA